LKKEFRGPEIPNAKSQISNNIKIPNPNVLNFGDVEEAVN
jgi:hypothetical protein